MARKPDPVKPMFPLKHEFEATLKNVLQEVAMLTSTLSVVIRHPESLAKPAVLAGVKERLDALHKAMYGDDAPE